MADLDYQAFVDIQASRFILLIKSMSMITMLRVHYIIKRYSNVIDVFSRVKICNLQCTIR